MSFDISIVNIEGEESLWEDVGNYTYNCNPMFALALNTVTGGAANAGDGSIKEIMGFHEGPKHRGSGLFALSDAPCVEAAGVLGDVIAEMAANPEPYEALNPENGWGDYGTFLNFLRRLWALCVNYPSGRIAIS